MPLFLLLACADTPDDTAPPSDDTAHDDPAPDTVALGGSCEMNEDRGGFSVTTTAAATSVDGSVADGVVPQSVLEPLVEDGDCAVLRRNNPFCDPACSPGETCDFDGSCLPYPANQDLGTVTLRGLATPVVMDPVFPGNTYFDTSLPSVAYEPGALLVLEMPGGTYGPATLYGVGVETLDMGGVGWTVASGMPLEVTWPPPAEGARTEVGVTLSIDQHGVSPSVLRCVFADDGAGTVPAAVITELVSVGVTGFPSASIERRTVDSASIDGGACMDFAVRAPVVVPLDVDGHTPCVTDVDCPDGQACDEELQTCG